MFYFFLAFYFLMICVFSITILGLSKTEGILLRYKRGMIVLLFLVYTLSSLVIMSDFLGKPKNIETVTNFFVTPNTEYEVLSYRIHYNVAVYLWVVEKEKRRPIYYVMKWDLDKVKELEAAERMRRTTNAKGNIMMNPSRRANESLDKDEAMFYPPPQEMVPEKTVPPQLERPESAPSHPRSRFPIPPTNSPMRMESYP